MLSFYDRRNNHIPLHDYNIMPSMRRDHSTARATLGNFFIILFFKIVNVNESNKKQKL